GGGGGARGGGGGGGGGGRGSRHAIAQVAGESGERLGDEGRALAIIGIHVGVAVGELLEEDVGPGMICERAVVVGKDARQIELREEFVELRALGRGFL